MSWEEEEEQTLVVNDCSRLMKTGFSGEWTLSYRVSILGRMRVLCGDYQQMKVMSICLWWTDRVHLELWQIGMGLNGDNLKSHIHHWIVCCSWRTSWFQLIFIDIKNRERDDDKNHFWIICCFWIDCFNEMDTKQGLSLPLMVMFVKLCL